MGYTITEMPPARICAAVHNPVGPATQPLTAYLPNPSFVYEDAMGASVKCLTKVEVNDIHCSPLTKLAASLEKAVWLVWLQQI